MTLNCSAAELERFCREVMVAAGVDAYDAAVVADNLTAANLRGVDSHGVIRLPSYMARLEAGLTAKKTVPEIVRETKASAVVDAHNGHGAPAGVYAMKVAIEKAAQTGVGVVGVKMSNHFGIAAYYGMMPLKRDMIGVSLTNASPSMAPWGGRVPYFGTNPICIAIPAGEERPIVYDGATSVVARGKIVLAQKKGVPIPPTWAADKMGRPTTDPNVAVHGGVLLPFGTYKGSGLALAVDVLSGVLMGAAFGAGIGEFYGTTDLSNLGHFFMALDVAAFGPVEEFKKKTDQMVREIKANPLADGIEKMYLPGEIEFDYEIERMANGCPVPEEVYKELAAYGKKYGVRSPALL